MHDKINPPKGIVLETEDAFERQLFERLGGIPERRPSERLRRSFYRRLGQARPGQPPQEKSTRTWLDWLTGPLAPALASLVIGLFIGAQLAGDRSEPSDTRIEELRAEVATLNATVALTLMQKQSAADRLEGVDVASRVAQTNPRVTDALLLRAATDSSQSVRSAAISALGPKLNDPGVAAEVQRLMLDTQSPLVQLAFVELVMRWGDTELLNQLVEAAEAGSLLPEVQRYVIEKVQRMSA